MERLGRRLGRHPHKDVPAAAEAVP
jgi:hypothetical protein